MGIPKLLLGLRDPSTNRLLETRVFTSSELAVLSGMAYQPSPESWPLMDAYTYAFKALSSIREYCQKKVDELEFEGIYDVPVSFRVKIRGKRTGTVMMEVTKVFKKGDEEVWKGMTSKELSKQLGMR
jgi:hypothetical protein